MCQVFLEISQVSWACSMVRLTCQKKRPLSLFMYVSGPWSAIYQLFFPSCSLQQLCVYTVKVKNNLIKKQKSTCYPPGTECTVYYTQWEVEAINTLALKSSSLHTQLIHSSVVLWPELIGRFSFHVFFVLVFYLISRSEVRPLFSCKV